MPFNFKNLFFNFNIKDKNNLNIIIHYETTLPLLKYKSIHIRSVKMDKMLF